MDRICLFILTLLTTKGTFAIDCFSCSWNEETADDLCITNPKSLRILDCENKFCASSRVEYVDPKNKLNSLVRFCADNPPKNQVIKDPTFVTYLRRCKSNLCNGGSAKGTTSGSQSHSDANLGPLIVPGVGRNHAHAPFNANTLLLIVTVVVAYFYNR